MGAFSSKPKSSKKAVISDADRAVLSLKTQRQKLESQEKLLQLRLDNYVTTAKQLLVESRKDRALLTLKKKKLTEMQLLQLHGLIMNVEQLLSNIESTKQSNQVFGVLKAGNDALKALQAQVRLDDVQRLMEDSAEANAYQRELNALLGEQLGGEEAEGAEEELEMLERMLEDEERIRMPTPPPVPASQKVAQTAQGTADEAGAEEAAAEKAGEGAVGVAKKNKKTVSKKKEVEEEEEKEEEEEEDGQRRTAVMLEAC